MFELKTNLIKNVQKNGKPHINITESAINYFEEFKILKNMLAFISENLINNC